MKPRWRGKGYAASRRRRQPEPERIFARAVDGLASHLPEWRRRTWLRFLLCELLRKRMFDTAATGDEWATLARDKEVFKRAIALGGGS